MVLASTGLRGRVDSHPADAGERWSAPARWGRALRKQQWRSDEQRRVQGCRRLVHPGRGCLPERRLWPGSGRSTPPTHPCVPRGSRKGGPGQRISGLDTEVPLGPGNLDLRPLLALSEHKSRPATSPHSTPYPHLWAAAVPAGAGLGAHALAAMLPWPDSRGAPGGGPAQPTAAVVVSVPSEHSLSHRSPRPLLRRWV